MKKFILNNTPWFVFAIFLIVTLILVLPRIKAFMKKSKTATVAPATVESN